VGGIVVGSSAPPLPLQCSVSKSKEMGRTFLPAGVLIGDEQSRMLAYGTPGADPSEKNCTLALTASRTLGAISSHQQSRSAPTSEPSETVCMLVLPGSATVPLQSAEVGST
jgi:hypothetical protein